MEGLKMDKKDDRYKKIYEKKKATTAEELAKGFPSEMCEYIKYTRNIDFEAKPDYNYLRGLLKNIMMKNSFEFDYYYDWCREKPVIPAIGSEKKEEDNTKEIMNNISNKEVLKTEENAKEKDNKINDIYNALETNEAQYNLNVPEDDAKDGNNKKEKNKDKTKSKKKCIIF